MECLVVYLDIAGQRHDPNLFDYFKIVIHVAGWWELYNTFIIYS